MPSSIKQLFRQTGSIVDYIQFVNAQNVEAITLRILEDMPDVLIECGYESAEEAYQKINETCDLIHYVQDGLLDGDEDLSVENHSSHLFEHLCFLHDKEEPEITDAEMAA